MTQYMQEAGAMKQAIHPNHLPDLRYARKVLENVRDLVLPTFHADDSAHGEVAAAINGMAYIIKRTEEAAALPPAAVQATRPPMTPLTDDETLSIHSMPYVRSMLLEYADKPCDQAANLVVRCITNALMGMPVGMPPAAANEGTLTAGKQGGDGVRVPGEGQQ